MASKEKEYVASIKVEKDKNEMYTIFVNEKWHVSRKSPKNILKEIAKISEAKKKVSISYIEL